MSINLKFPLRTHFKGYFEGNETRIKAARENIKTLLLTRKGEIPCNYEIGMPNSLYELMFEQINDEEFEIFVKKNISTAISQFLPEITLIDVKVWNKDTIPNGIAGLNTNQILIRMRYLLGDEEDEIDLRT